MRRSISPSNGSKPRGPDWLDDLVGNLQNRGAVGNATVAYLHDAGVHLSLYPQSSGARWLIGRRIQLNPSFALGPAVSPYAMSLLVHEVRHLRQGALTALSVYGELEAWQAQFRFLIDPLGGGQEQAQQPSVIQQLLHLPLGWDRAVLENARRLMKAFAGHRYRIELLPLYPLGSELVHALTGRSPDGFDQTVDRS
jgi:hypothetical protein